MNNEAHAPGWRWPLWGVAAGILGYVGHLFTAATVTDEERASGASVIDALNQDAYHFGIIAGLLAVFCLLVFAEGWRRWAALALPGSHAAGVATLALVASAGAMILGYGFKGALTVYLPDGMNAGNYPAEGLYALFMFDDLGPFIAWYGVAMAAGALTWVSLVDHGLPRWIGILSLFFVLAPVAMLVVTGLPGFPGVVDPLWLIITGIGMSVILRRMPNVGRQPDLASP